MITEKFKKACASCTCEEEFKSVLDLHKTELTDEELRQVAGGSEINPFGASSWITDLPT